MKKKYEIHFELTAAELVNLRIHLRNYYFQHVHNRDISIVDRFIDYLDSLTN